MDYKKSLVPTLFMAMIIMLLFAWSSFSAGKGSGLVAPRATLKTIQSGFNGTESPAKDADGNVWFTKEYIHAANDG